MESKWLRRLIMGLLALNISINMAILLQAWEVNRLLAMLNVIAIALGLVVGVFLGRSK